MLQYYFKVLTQSWRKHKTRIPVQPNGWPYPYKTYLEIHKKCLEAKCRNFQVQAQSVSEAEKLSAHQHARSHHKEECQCDDCLWTPAY